MLRALKLRRLLVEQPLAGRAAEVVFGAIGGALIEVHTPLRAEPRLGRGDSLWIAVQILGCGNGSLEILAADVALASAEGASRRENFDQQIFLRRGELGFFRARGCSNEGRDR